MSRRPEDSPHVAGASNARSPLRLLAEACAQAAAEGRGRHASPIEPLLRLVLEATHAERAFLVRVPEGPVEGDPVPFATVRPAAASDEPSHTILRAALERGRSWVCPDLAGDPRLGGGASVRALALQSVLAAPLPGAGGGRGALVLDSRRPLPRLLPLGLADTLEAFAALIALRLATGAAGSGPGDDSVEIASRSEAMRRMLDWAARVAATELPVLLRGETGTGKEALARRIHAQSARASGPLLAINCAALPETLLEAELFGCVRGAYTGADRDRPGLFRLAGGGTLLLDEIGDMPPAMQAKLLRVVQERRVRAVGAELETMVDVRLLAATHRDLAALVAAGRFRADLLHRLAVVEVRLPPLRERIEDLRVLVASLGPRLARETGLEPPRVAPCAWHVLEAHDWPGNVRELHAIVARAMLRAAPGAIEARHLDAALGAGADAAAGAATTLEERMIRAALAAEGGALSRAARSIGWSRQKLYRRMQALGLRRPQLSSGASRTTSS